MRHRSFLQTLECLCVYGHPGLSPFGWEIEKGRGLSLFGTFMGGKQAFEGNGCPHLLGRPALRNRWDLVCMDVDRGAVVANRSSRGAVAVGTERSEIAMSIWA